MSTPGPRVPLDFQRLSAAEAKERVCALRDALRTRRSVRDFAPDPLPPGVLDEAIAIAASAPSGANRQPWRFVVVEDAETKARIREAAEAEEREFYGRRITPPWRADLQPLGTDASKPFLSIAPALVVVFRVDWEPEDGDDGVPRPHKNYYVQESVGIAVGFFLAALHMAGLVALTHTPSPMAFLSQILDRPRHEKPYLLIPVGYPAPGATVPAITRKSLDEVRIPFRPR